MKNISMEEANKIALSYLFIENLQPVGRDTFDFHSVGVRGIYDALNAAYKAGQQAKKRSKKTRS